MGFWGSDLGKEYSAKGVIESLAQTIVKEQEAPVIQRPTRITSVSKDLKEDLNLAGEKEKSNVLETTIALLMGPAKNDNNFVPSQLTRKKKKRKRQSQRF